MKRLLFLLSIILFFVAPLHAEKIDVYFGTGGRGSKGIYMAKFDTEKGKLSQPTLAAEINGPGFLAWHPDGTKIYAVAGI